MKSTNKPKSLYLYYKKNIQAKNYIYFYIYFILLIKQILFKFGMIKFFFIFVEGEINNHTKKNENNKFNALIEISSIINNLDFSADTQFDIIIHLIKK